MLNQERPGRGDRLYGLRRRAHLREPRDVLRAEAVGKIRDIATLYPLTYRVIFGILDI